MNDYQIIEQFQEAMLEHGITPPKTLKADGTLHRFHIAGDKSGTLNGAYKLYLTGIRPAGYFENFKTGEKVNWKLDGPLKELTPEEKRAYAEQQRQQQAKRQADERVKQLNAANKAQSIWATAKPVTNHPYLIRKRIQAHGAKEWKGSLMIPLYDASLRLVNLQFIAAEKPADGATDKRFLSGGQKKAAFWWIGQRSEKILIAEGFATAATLHEATGHRCFIAFDAGNLPPVAEIIRAKHPQAHIVICADNDTSGRGQEAAEEAALACDGLVAIPPEPGLDFNDWALALQNQPPITPTREG